MKKILLPTVLTLLFMSASSCSINNEESWNSALISYSADGKIVYHEDSDGLCLPDFSHAGYHEGERSLPKHPATVSISPIEGDNTSHIQTAIDELCRRPLKDGHRGVLLLKSGTYPVEGVLRVWNSGVVIRGEGNEGETQTLLYGTGDTPHKRTLLKVGNDAVDWEKGETERIMIDDELLKTGTTAIHLERTDGLNENDRIVIRQDITQKWLDIMGNGIGTDSLATPWTLNEMCHKTLDLAYVRRIISINEETREILIDAPVFCPMEKAISAPYIYRTDASALITECGVENIRFDSEYDSSVVLTFERNGETYLGDENHAGGAVEFQGTENCWARDLIAEHFSGHFFACKSSLHNTITNCQAIDPISIIKGGRRYGFVTKEYGQLLLFENCYGRKGRHHFVSNGTAKSSGNVYLDCKSEDSYASSEGHRRWSQGFLFDNYKEISLNGSYDFTLGFYNRGRMGTTHGWSMVTGVAWNCDLTTGVSGKGHLLVQQPPIGQNYAIGCKAALVDNKPLMLYKTEKCGYIEGTNHKGLTPESLYREQLNNRLYN